MVSTRSMQIAQARAVDRVFTQYGLVSHILVFITDIKDKKKLRLVNKMMRDAVDRTVTSVSFPKRCSWDKVELFIKAGKWNNIEKIHLLVENPLKDGVEDIDINTITLLTSRPWQKLKELELYLPYNFKYNTSTDDSNQSLNRLLVADWNLTRLTVESSEDPADEACYQWTAHLLKHMNWNLKELRLDFYTESDESVALYNALADASTKSLSGLTKLELQWSILTDYRGLGSFAHARLEQLQHLVIQYQGLDDAGFATVPRISSVLEYLEVPSEGTLETIEGSMALATELPGIKVLKIGSKITNTAAVALFKNANWPLIEELMVYAIDRIYFDQFDPPPVPFEHPNDQALAAFSERDWPHLKKLALNGFRLSQIGPGWKPLANKTWPFLDTLYLSYSLGKKNYDVITPEAFPMLQHLQLDDDTPLDSTAVATALMNKPWKRLTRLEFPMGMFHSRVVHGHETNNKVRILDGFEAFANQLRVASTDVHGFDEEAKAAYYERLSALQKYRY